MFSKDQQLNQSLLNKSQRDQLNKSLLQLSATDQRLEMSTLHKIENEKSNKNVESISLWQKFYQRNVQKSAPVIPNIYHRQRKKFCLVSMIVNLHQQNNLTNEQEVSHLCEELAEEQIEGCTQTKIDIYKKKCLKLLQEGDGNFAYSVEHRILSKNLESSHPFPLENFKYLNSFLKKKNFRGMMVHIPNQIGNGGHFVAIHHDYHTGNLFLIDGIVQDGKPNIKLLTPSNYKKLLHTNMSIWGVWDYEEDTSVKWGDKNSSYDGISHVIHTTSYPWI